MSKITILPLNCIRGKFTPILEMYYCERKTCYVVRL